MELIAAGPRSLVYRATDTAFSDAALNTAPHATPHTAGRHVVIKINPHHTDAPLEALAVARQELARLRAECKGVTPDTDATWSLLEIYAIAIDAADPTRSTLDRAANRHRLRTLLAPALPTEARDVPLHAVARQSQTLMMLLHGIADPDAEPLQPVLTPETTTPDRTGVK